MNCPKCEGEIRQIVSVSIDIPVTIKAMTKKNIVKKETKILGADWGNSYYYCPCGWWENVKGMNLLTVTGEKNG